MRLRYLRRALGQLETVLGELRERSPEAAVEGERRIAAALAMLLQHPSAGARTSFPGVRRIHLVPVLHAVDYFAGEDIVVQRLRRLTLSPEEQSVLGGPTPPSAQAPDQPGRDGDSTASSLSDQPAVRRWFRPVDARRRFDTARYAWSRLAEQWRALINVGGLSTPASHRHPR